MFKTLLAISLLIAIASGGILPPEFVEQEGRIVGGATAREGQFPYVCSLRTLRNFHYCGCAIIGPRWVVSAAHCFIGPVTAKDVLIVVGAHTITDGTPHYCSQIVKHPEFSDRTLENDIAVLQTTTPIQLSPRVRIVELGAFFVEAGPVNIMGWGFTTAAGNPATELQYLNQTVVSLAECQRLWGYPVHFNFLCTLAGPGKGSCGGDSGGPVVTHGSEQLVGVISFSNPCARGVPDVSTRISLFRNWILHIIN